MPTRNYKPEQIVTILRQIEVQMANGRLKRLVAVLSLEKQVLKDVAEGNF